MTYAVSDIHGHYDKYSAMLRSMNLRPDDTLYVLGDAVDRGPEPMKVLTDMMSRPNVIPILGNHEFMAAYCLRFLAREITDEAIAALDGARLAALSEWLDPANGGQATLDDFRRLSPEDRLNVLDYLGDFSLYEVASTGGNDYVLVHAGLAGFSPDRPLEDYRPDELILGRADYGRTYYPDRYLVTGHTPTRNIPGNPEPNRIFRANGHIAIDCGCWCGGHLGVICLDTGEELYA